MQFSDAVDPVSAKKIARKGRREKCIIKQREEMASISATIQEPIFDEEVIPANEGCVSHFGNECLQKQLSTSESFDNEIAEFPKVKFPQFKNNGRLSSLSGQIQAFRKRCDWILCLLCKYGI